jgi:hypothetical protein
MYDNTIRVNPKEYIGKVLNCDLMAYDGSMLHKSGDIFTEEEAEACRKARLIQKHYFGDEEYMYITAEASGKKCYEIEVQVSVSYDTYRVWANSKEEALQELEDDPGDPWDSDGERCWEVISVKDTTENTLEWYENQAKWEIERKERELKQLKQRWRESGK